MCRFIVITGGVISGIGKGIITSSIGVILKESGLNITCIKIDPYLNINAGNMSPYEHGEVFVLNDGGEADLDLGNYERYMDITLTKDHNITTGKIYQKILDREKNGDYLGKTIQMVPHMTDLIQEWIQRVAKIPVFYKIEQREVSIEQRKVSIEQRKVLTKENSLSEWSQQEKKLETSNICIIELGGTVGDIESAIYLEALRQLKFNLPKSNFCHIHVSMIPINIGNEPKTKPTQQSIKELRTAGLVPNVVICRSNKPVDHSIRNKISASSMISPDNILFLPDVDDVYKVPYCLLQQKISLIISNTLGWMHAQEPKTLTLCDKITELNNNCISTVKIGIVGKYTGLYDSYISVIKALETAALHNNRKLEIIWINAEHLELGDFNENRNKAWRALTMIDGLLCPGGFGDRAIEGKILAINYARIHNIPFLGICLGMQAAIIEFARNAVGLENANSTEFDPNCKYPIIKLNHDRKLRLGTHFMELNRESFAYNRIYNKAIIYERYRNRYYVDRLIFMKYDFYKFGMKIDDNNIYDIAIISIPTYKFFVGVQFHPEFLSRPLKPHPLFTKFITMSCYQ